LNSEKSFREYPKCKTKSLSNEKREPFYNVNKPESISVKLWKCNLCGYEEIETSHYEK
jgi:hypothetical protein